jgi:phosphoenolpyruvate carboxykinase (diphosphate)
MPTTNPSLSPAQLRLAINLRLGLLGCAPAGGSDELDLAGIAAPLFAQQRELSRRLAQQLPPVDERIQHFLNTYLAETGPAPRLPSRTFVLDRPGIARELSLPAEGDTVDSPLLKSYRLLNGVLHNPANDRRTTQGVFHIAEGGLPVPDDKLAVPKLTFSRLLDLALHHPADLLRLPYTAGRPSPAECIVSLLLRPLVVPAVPGFTGEKRMEIRFFAPGSLVSNLDFVEGIFGNAGDPFLAENDAALDVDGWTGHTGCVILAPHLVGVRKHLVGLPHWDLATPRQRRDGMCWKTEDELYNGGSAFKVCARDARGVMVTLIADNYYGYCKKEVKTQISYAANLFGLAEEEHAGGALVFPSYDLGEDFSGYTRAGDASYTVAAVVASDPELWAVQAEGHAVSTQDADTVLVPEETHFELRKQSISWQDAQGAAHRIKLLAGKTYIRPGGYRVHMEPVRGERGQWRLVGTVPETTLCHKPSTVSGGGKSEISKAISDAILPGHVFVADFDKDIEAVAELLERDYSDRFLDPARAGKDRRPVLGAERTLGSVIKLLTPSRRDYTPDYNRWLASIPQHIKELVFVIKRHHKPEWAGDWRAHYSVDTINGRPGNELKLDGRKLIVNTLRVGYEADGAWRVFGLRHDFHPAAKVQMEDDITASVVAPIAPQVPGLDARVSLKFVQNCEALLFQRPDDAIHRGYDKQAESDIATPGTFLSNYAPLTAGDARAFIEDAVGFSAYTAPMQAVIRKAAANTTNASPAYFVSSAHPRIVGGKPSKNPRYLQVRPDVANPKATALAYLGLRLSRRLAADAPVHARQRGRARPPQQSARTRRARAVLFQPAALPGAAGTLHGVHQLDDRQVPLDHRRRQRRRAHQEPVQRAPAGHRPQRRAGLRDSHRPRRVPLLGRLRRPQGARRSRRLAARA